MRIYIGRWDLLPEDMEGYNGLSQMDSWDASEEVAYEKRHSDDKFIGEYSGEEFEETFNQFLTSFIDSRNYWIKIF